MQLANYLFFTTECEAALSFYAECGLCRVATSMRHEDPGIPVGQRNNGGQGDARRLLELLQAASALPLTDDEQITYDGLIADLLSVDGWTEELLAGFEGQGTEKRVRAFLMTQRHHVA